MKKVELITLERLLEMRENGEHFKLIDVLPESSFREGHLPDAINIPVEKLDTEVPRYIGRRVNVVVYCGGFSCPASTTAAKKLKEMGYSHTLDFKAGKSGWKAAGLQLAA
jgi:rhodanese-related sulfurtransferase